MRVFRAGAAALCLAAATAACSGSDSQTGYAGGWHASAARTSISGVAQNCPTPNAVLDTFERTPTPNPSCSPAAGANYRGGADAASPTPSAAPAQWQGSRVEQYRSTSSGWQTIYTTYTAPPATGIYAPAVHATTQPMPTPFTTPTPQPLRTSTPSSPVTPMATQAPVFVPSSMP